jgi:hypothetical protein
MRRKIGKRTYHWPTAAEIPALPPPPPPEDEDLPAAKKQRLQAPTSNSTAVDEVTTDSSDDTPTAPATPAASLPSGGASSHLRRHFTPEGDAKLTEAVKKHGTDWVTVAALVDGRTNYQCRQRWTTKLDPAIEKSEGKWKGEEDAKLTEAVKKHGTDWVAVAALVDGRTNHQCRQRWTRNLDPDRASNKVDEDPDRR